MADSEPVMSPEAAADHHLAMGQSCRRRLAPWLTVVLVILGAASACGLMAAAIGLPTPRVHDEFSYLLAADTFAHGRLANPPHPMAEHFATFHVLDHPTYASKYPPVQGLLLAAGKVFTGRPVVGVWLSVGLLAGSLYWMLDALLPHRWALLGTLLGTARFGVLSYWGHGYWGGAAAAMAGCLLFGAVARLIRGGEGDRGPGQEGAYDRKPARRAASGAMLGAALVLLANSRPWEGLLVSVPAAAAVLAWIIVRRRAGRSRDVILPAAVAAGVLAIGFIAMAVYNKAVTGDATVLPYQAHNAAYDFIPAFLWQDLGPVPDYEHPRIARFYLELNLADYQSLQTPGGYFAAMATRLRWAWGFYFGPVLVLPLLGALRRDRGLLLAWGMVAVSVVAVLVGTYFKLHYIAPATGAVVLLWTSGLRACFARWPILRRHQRPLLAAFVLLALLSSWPMVHEQWDIRHDAEAWWNARMRLITRLREEPRRDLVLVRYDPSVSLHTEFVYNGADIDAQPIIFARALGPQRDRELIQHYAARQPDRNVWLLHLEQDELSMRMLRQGVGEP